jgi:hypothetical protein
MPEYYAYRIFPADRIEERLNEARERGWSVHTFTDATEETWATALLQWAGTPDGREWMLPLADDEEPAP